MHYILIRLYTSTSFQKLCFLPLLIDFKCDLEYYFFDCKNCHNNYGQPYYICNLCKITKKVYGSHGIIGKTLMPLMLITDISSIFSSTSFIDFNYH